jgi:hypothetical protein
MLLTTAAGTMSARLERNMRRAAAPIRSFLLLRRRNNLILDACTPSEFEYQPDLAGFFCRSDRLRGDPLRGDRLRGDPLRGDRLRGDPLRGDRLRDA